MKVTVIQPEYSMNFADADRCFKEYLNYLEQCDETSDIIVLPEYCDIPVACPNEAGFKECIKKYNRIIAEKCAETAKRCSSLLFANYAESTEKGYANVTHCFNREGEEIGRYFKAHPAPSEVKTAAQGGNEMDCSYSYEYAPPYILEAEGLRFAFLTCYDFYMYEMFPVIARAKPDIIIGCSHQRTDTHDALEIIGRFLCYNTNAYLVRSSVSLGESSGVCGCSMVVSPKGEMLLNMKSRIGIESTEIDVNEKYFKPAGFKGKPKAHFEYINDGRRGWLYRPSGSMISADDEHMPYPRICAHRGFNTVAPENSMPAFGSAVALGAQEIEFDIWATKDGELVSIHDERIDRVADGFGKVSDYTLAELKEMDFGRKYSEKFAGLSIITFEEILKKFSCTAVMNIHVKIWDKPDGEHYFEKIASLIRQYSAEKHCYMMNSNDDALIEFHKIAPDISLCVGWNREKTNYNLMVDRAIKIGAKKVQLFKPYFDKSTVDYAHENGIICNVFYADDPDEAKKYIEMGIDCILTNDYLNIKNALGNKVK